MSRWEPGSELRLQAAAMALFTEHGYENVTVAQIAAKAGLTRRSFFNHFTDKREIFFSRSAEFQASVVEHLAGADLALSPVQAAVAALTAAGRDLAAYREYAPAVQALIATSIEMRERELSKTAAITDGLVEGLRARGVPPRTAMFAAKAAVTAYTTAWAEWVDNPDEEFGTLMQRALSDLRDVLTQDHAIAGEGHS